MGPNRILQRCWVPRLRLRGSLRLRCCGRLLAHADRQQFRKNVPSLVPQFFLNVSIESVVNMQLFVGDVRGYRLVYRTVADQHIENLANDPTTAVIIQRDFFATANVFVSHVTSLLQPFDNLGCAAIDADVIRGFAVFDQRHHQAHSQLPMRLQFSAGKGRPLFAQVNNHRYLSVYSLLRQLLASGLAALLFGVFGRFQILGAALIRHFLIACHNGLGTFTNFHGNFQTVENQNAVQRFVRETFGFVEQNA
uniref:Uncharacterized protein n=1 Tax=Myoviridae sp. ctshb19 TaxID=2825194 RepID=A0A8S5UGM2_9CAUD|nr:MAG TPA: hypothetical protein [Myoviridae sp. ctshb19]